MKIYWQILILLSFVSCSQDDQDYVGGNPKTVLEREETEIICPVHQVAVFKVHASGGISCPIWYPKLGLTVEQIRNRFPFAVWDSNLHHVDDSPGAKFPIYNFVCDRCVSSWNEYAAANPIPRETKFIISIPESQKILINGTEFSIDQISAIAKAVSSHHANPRVNLRAHKSTPAELIKAIVSACKEGGLTEVIFGSIVDETGPVPKEEGEPSAAGQPATRLESK